MGSRIYKPTRNDHVTDGSEVLRENAHNISVNQLIPRIAVKNQIAVETIPTPLFFFAKIRAGRRCSCFDIEVSPTSLCRCCYGTGIVGGYEKYGTNQEIIDVTHPSIRTINVIPDYTRRDKPRQFVLIDGATEGFLITRVQVQTNIGSVDHVQALRDIPSGTELSAWIKGPTDSEFVGMDGEHIALSDRLVHPWIEVMIRFKRPTVAAPSPRFGLLSLRYSRVQDRSITANIPRTEKSNMLQEFGVTDDWQAQKFWMPNKLRSITTEDWVIHATEQTRWKIITVSDFAPNNLLVSWDLDTRLIHPYEPISQFPIGT